jgi:Tfp pilus assembly protein PilF
MNSGFAKQRGRAEMQGRSLVGRALMIRSMLGTALEHHRAGRMTEAEQIYRQILTVDARHSDSLHLLGMIEHQAGRHDAAVDLIRRAIAIHEQGASYHSNLGTVLQAQGNLEEAAACYQRALVLRPDLAEVHTNLGNILQSLGKLDEAMACHERALRLAPQLTEARYNLGLVQLHRGDFTSGWQNFESRWQSRNFATQMRVYPQPLWTGETLGSGRVLVWGEQGVGDEVMFAGLIPDVIRTGNRCLLDCDPRLKLLFARSFPGVDVVAKHCNLSESPDGEILAHLPSGSLPKLFRATSTAFAATTAPYLIADTVQRDQFRTRYTGPNKRRLVGLAWHTRNRSTGRHRSIDLSMLAPLFARPDIRWVGLQYGNHEELERQAAAANAPIFIDRSVDQLVDIDVFAAQLAAMDIVITIDNSTAHLAGALGVPTFVMLPAACDWRWFQKREDSPWYPSLRLFRQTDRGDWESVVERVRSAM